MPGAERRDTRRGAAVDIAVEELGARSDGIGRGPDGEAVFVHGAPPCPHFGTCGGCDAQHMDGALYRDWKEGLVRDALARAGVSAEVAPLVAVPPESRRRARLFARRRTDGVVLGFHAAGSHTIVDMTACPVLDPALFGLIAPLRSLFREALAPGDRAEAEAQAVGGALDLVVRLPGALDLELRERLAAFAAEAGLARLGWQALPSGPGRRGRARPAPPEPVVERAPVAATFGGVAVPLPPLAFLQPSAAGERVLAECVAGAVPEGARTADLFAGAGTFTFPLAAKGAVAAFDADGELVAALDAAARAAGLGPRVSATVRDLMRAPVTVRELEGYGAAVFDPPRAGAAAQARELSASAVPVVVAVSCNPRSFARDARTLVDGGYRPGPVTPVDQFPWTRHLELAAVFRR